MNTAKTFALLAALTALFGFAGFALGGQGGLVIALVLAAGMNMISFWMSDKLVLKMHGAKEVTSKSAPEFYRLVQDLAQKAELPMPRVYIIETDQPNAFATGRSPHHAAVAATTGLMRMLNREELAGVMAHELAHVKNRDTLTMTITATLAGAISMLANMAFFTSLFGGRDRGPASGIIMLAMAILAPMAAGVVQMAISRSREYEADKIGAQICRNPMALASALQKIDQRARGVLMDTAERNPATAHMFIINPLNAGPGARSMDNLFSTHPSTRNRIEALVQMARDGGQATSTVATTPAQNTRANGGANGWGRKPTNPKGTVSGPNGSVSGSGRRRTTSVPSHRRRP